MNKEKTFYNHLIIAIFTSLFSIYLFYLLNILNKNKFFYNKQYNENSWTYKHQLEIKDNIRELNRMLKNQGINLLKEKNKTDISVISFIINFFINLLLLFSIIPWFIIFNKYYNNEYI